MFSPIQFRSPRLSGLRTVFSQIGYRLLRDPMDRECACFQGLAISASHSRPRTRLRDEALPKERDRDDEGSGKQDNLRENGGRRDAAHNAGVAGASDRLGKNWGKRRQELSGADKFPPRLGVVSLRRGEPTSAACRRGHGRDRQPVPRSDRDRARRPCADPSSPRDRDARGSRSSAPPPSALEH